MSVARRLIGDRELLKRIAEYREAAEQSGAEPADPSDVYEIVQKMVDEELAAIAENYEGGLFISTGNEKFRMERIREICSGAARFPRKVWWKHPSRNLSAGTAASVRS